MDFTALSEDTVAYRIDYVAVDGRTLSTAVDTIEEARSLVSEIEARGDTVTLRRVEHGRVAASLLLTVAQAQLADPTEVF